MKGGVGVAAPGAGTLDPKDPKICPELGSVSGDGKHSLKTNIPSLKERILLRNHQLFRGEMLNFRGVDPEN